MKKLLLFALLIIEFTTNSLISSDQNNNKIWRIVTEKTEAPIWKDVLSKVKVPAPFRKLKEALSSTSKKLRYCEPSTIRPNDLLNFNPTSEVDESDFSIYKKLVNKSDISKYKRLSVVSCHWKNCITSPDFHKCHQEDQDVIRWLSHRMFEQINLLCKKKIITQPSIIRPNDLLNFGPASEVGKYITSPDIHNFSQEDQNVIKSLSHRIFKRIDILRHRKTKITTEPLYRTTKTGKYIFSKEPIYTYNTNLYIIKMIADIQFIQIFKERVSKNSFKNIENEDMFIRILRPPSGSKEHLIRKIENNGYSCMNCGKDGEKPF